MVRKEGIKMEMKRRPKGMGSVVKLSGNRRKPYVATINKVSYGTYKTQQECERALLHAVLKQESVLPEYIQGLPTLEIEYTNFIMDLQSKGILSTAVFDFPTNMDIFNEAFKSQLLVKGIILQSNSSTPLIIESIPTFAEIWGIEMERIKNLRSKSWMRAVSIAYRHLSLIQDSPITQIKTPELQKCFDKQMDAGSGKSKLMHMKNVCRIVFSYALKMDYISKDYTTFLNLHPTNDKKNNRKVFTPDEIKLLIEDNTDASKIILIYIYTGMRPSELLAIPIEDIHIEERYMIGGLKTQAGKNRIIPLHDQIVPYIKYFLDKGFTNLLSDKYSYETYRKIFHSTMDYLKLDHNEPYDTRHTFSTIAKINRVESTARKKIMGHACNDITDDVYTHEPLSYLLEEINKIKVC